MVRWHQFINQCSIVILSIMLCNCVGYTPVHHPRHLAPVRKAVRVPMGRVHAHRVQHGETLYAIAFRYSLDYRHLASVNGLSLPYALEVGQLLRIPQDNSEFLPQPLSYKGKILKYKNGLKAQSEVDIIPKARVFATIGRKSSSSLSKTMSPLSWPTQGKIITFFAPAIGNKGLDIQGKWRQPVLSIGAGEVVYAGNGLPAYGNLLIIKHNNEILSAYAHNNQLLVKEGQRVKAQQKIAEMGQDDRKRTVLHFEIRKNGKPVNPIEYLRQGAK